MINPSYTPFIAKSFGLHIIFAVVLVLSFNFSPPAIKPEKAPEISAIDAVVIDAAALEQQVNKVKQQQADKKAAEEKRVKELEDRANKANQNIRQ